MQLLRGICDLFSFIMDSYTHRGVNTTRAAMRIIYLVKIFIPDYSFGSLTLEFIRGKRCVYVVYT